LKYYHCSPTAGLRVLEPRRPEHFSKPAGVYLSTLVPMALMYGIRNFEYSYGYTRDGRICFDEYFPDALEVLYRGKAASLYLCEAKCAEATAIPNEAFSREAVTVLEEIRIPDVCEALLEQERLGNLIIQRYGQQSAKMLDWIRKVEADTIREQDLLNREGPMADYYRQHYPESWALVAASIL